MDPQSQFGLASVKFLHGSQIVICNPQMEMPDASISICGSLREALWWSRLGSTSFLVLFCQLGKFLGARHLPKTPKANGHCEGREGARREMGPGGGDDPGGGAKRSPLLEFMRRDLAENAPKRPGAAERSRRRRKSVLATTWRRSVPSSRAASCGRGWT